MNVLEIRKSNALDFFFSFFYDDEAAVVDTTVGVGDQREIVFSTIQGLYHKKAKFPSP